MRTLRPSIGSNAAWHLLSGRNTSIALITAASLSAGLLEAGFLVSVTSAAFATADDATPTLPLLGHRSMSFVIVAAFAMLMCRLATALLLSYLTAKLTNAVTRELRSSLVDAWLSSNWEAKGRLEGGQLQELVGSMAYQATVYVQSMSNGLVAFVNLVTILGVALIVNPLAAVVVLCAVAILTQVIRPIRSAVRRQSEETATASLAGASTLAEMSQLRTEIHTFGAQESFQGKLDHLVEWYERVNRRLDFLRSSVGVAYSTLAYLAVLGALALAASSDLDHVDSIGAVMLLMLRSLTYGQGLQTAVTTMSSAAPFIERIESQRRKLRDHAVRRGGHAADGIDARVETSGVNFAYETDQPVLVGVDLDIRVGEILGIAGPSGGGKSTLVSLLLGLRQPTSGSIRLGGVPIGDIDPAAWVRAVSFVPQRPRLIRGTVADNIRFLREWVTDDDVETAAQSAQLGDDLSQWPEGLQRPVGDGGEQLSGGQQQRVCIARALAGRPAVLMLDEPTSALDPHNESRLAEVLSALRGEVTIILVAHRKTTLDVCDRVIEVRGGSVRAVTNTTEVSLDDF